MIKLGDTGVSKLYLGDTEIKKAYVGEELIYQEKSGRLPDGYTEVEYIQFGNLDAIHLVSISASDHITMDVQPLSYTKSKENLFYTERDFSSRKNLFCMQRVSSTSARISITEIFGEYVPVADNDRITIDINLPKKIIKIGSNTYNPSTYGNIVYEVLGLGYNGEPSNSYPTAPAKWYSVKIYNYNGEPFRDYVPCKDQSGNIGMYDLITSTFSAGINGGGLTAGPAV